MKATEVTYRCLVDRARHTPDGACSMDAQSIEIIGGIPFRENDRPAVTTATSAIFRARVSARFAVGFLQAVASRAPEVRAVGVANASAKRVPEAENKRDRIG